MVDRVLFRRQGIQDNQSGSDRSVPSDSSCGGVVRVGEGMLSYGSSIADYRAVSFGRAMTLGRRDEIALVSHTDDWCQIRIFDVCSVGISIS